jgi:hypothetical protein
VVAAAVVAVVSPMQNLSGKWKQFYLEKKRTKTTFQ